MPTGAGVTNTKTKMIGYRHQIRTLRSPKVLGYNLVLSEISGKIAIPESCLPMLLDVIGTDTDRSATYDFMFHSNCGPFTYQSEINGDFRRKSQFGTTSLFPLMEMLNSIHSVAYCNG